MTLPLDPPLPPDTPLRLCIKTSRGMVTVLTAPAGRKAEATAWAMQALAFAPDIEWRWHETGGRFVRDELWAYFEGKGPAPVPVPAGEDTCAKLRDKLARIAAVLAED